MNVRGESGRNGGRQSEKEQKEARRENLERKDWICRRKQCDPSEFPDCVVAFMFTTSLQLWQEYESFEEMVSEHLVAFNELALNFYYRKFPVYSQRSSTSALQRQSKQYSCLALIIHPQTALSFLGPRPRYGSCAPRCVCASSCAVSKSLNSSLTTCAQPGRTSPAGDTGRPPEAS